MNHRTIKSIIFLIVGSLAGCGDGLGFWSSPEEKINAAYPASDEVGRGVASILKDAPTDHAKSIKLHIDSRFKLRALNCAKGYAPSWYSSKSEVRKNIGTSTCFAETDTEIRKWLGLLRAGIILAKPALKLPPKTPPSFLVADAFITSAQFADNAAIALLESQNSISIIDFESTNPLFREPRGAKVGRISPNGRLFVTGDSNGDSIKIRDSESGATIVEIPFVHSFQFHWLDFHTAIYMSRDSRKPIVINFDSGLEIKVDGVGVGFDQATQVPDMPDQYVLFTGTGVSKIQLLRGQKEPEVKLIVEKPMSAMTCAINTSGKTADGTRFFCASRNLKLVSLNSLEIESVTLEPFQIQWGVVTPDPDQILLKGFVQPSHGENGGEYLYSIVNHTMTKIDRDRSMSDRFVAINSIQKQAVINQDKIEILTELPRLSPISAQAFASSAQEIVNNRKLDTFDQQSLQGIANSGQFTKAPTKSAVTGPLAELAKDAQVEAVGVYQGNSSGSKTADRRNLGFVDVQIRGSTKPIILVLSSYEPVRWNLIQESNARLVAVLVSSYYPSQVVGAGTAPIVINGSSYAYKIDSPEYRVLNQAVNNIIGKSIGVFQGRYDGGQYKIGSFARW